MSATWPSPRRPRRRASPLAAKLFRAVAESEKVHANEYLTKYLLGVIGTTEENLQTAFENEIKAQSEGYAALIKEAIARNREDVTWSFVRSRDVEGRHAKLYKEALTALAMDKEIDYHVCQVCGYVFDGPTPEECPVCFSSRENFQKIY
ncbi:MAG: rubrerythrin family protein [Pseudomonadota bacterium]